VGTPGRNDPCHCGSGKKFKKCHGRVELTARARPRSGVPTKTQEEIEGMRKAGKLAAQILQDACARVVAGVTTLDIDGWVHQMTLDGGAYPSPLNYPHAPTDPRSPVIGRRGFPKSVCTSINDVVCHGIPDDTVLREGDIVNVDVTCTLEGFHGDTSRTVMIGDVSAEARLVTEVAKEGLDLAIAEVRDGALFSRIGAVIQALADKKGGSVVRDFTGHGIGRGFHEPPAILHYPDKSLDYPMEAGHIFTIEPMINGGTHHVNVDHSDGWTARTRDGRPSAQFEHTILVTEDGSEVLTAAPA
jgi:methionyl aminopeptidase